MKKTTTNEGDLQAPTTITREGSQTFTTEDQDRITDEYQKQSTRNQALLEEVVFILRQRIESSGIKIHDIEHRIKKLPSLLEKCQSKGFQGLSDIVDVVGVRVVCLFRSDMSKVSEILASNFLVVSVDDKVSTGGPLGYQSTHYVCEMPNRYKGPRYENTTGVRFEVQVRTLCMHAWAAVSHHLDYKGDWDVPKDLKQALSALSGLFYVADNQFEQFYAARVKSQENVKAGNQDQEINLDTMNFYLAERFPDRAPGGAVQVSEIVQEVKAAGYHSIAELDRDIARGLPAFYQLERKRRPKSGRYIGVGVVRVTLRLVSEKFRELEESGAFGDRTKYDEAYEAVARLIKPES